MNDGNRLGGTTDERSWGGKQVKTRRRRARLAPGVVGLCLIMVLGSLVVSSSPGAVATSPAPSPSCITSPNSQGAASQPQPACGGGGGTCTATFSVSYSVSVQATNATIYFTPTLDPIQYCTLTTTISIHWGNTTSEVFTAVNSQQFTADLQYSVFLNYLQPSTTYYFEIDGSSDYGSHDYGSSWSTSADSSTSIQGTVYDATNNATPTQTLIVEAWCLSSVSSYVWSYTNSAGKYSFSVSSLGCSSYGSGGKGAYVVNLGEANPGFWSGHWNETIVVWAPQTVNLYLPRDYVSGLVPATYDFTNSSYTTFTVSTSQTLTNQEQTSISVQGALDGLSLGAGTSYQTTSSLTTQTTYTSVTGDSYQLSQEYDVTGMVVFSAISRATNLFADFFEPSGTISSGSTTISDWLARPACNSDPTIVICQYYQGSQPWTTTMSSAGSVTLSSSFNIGVSLTVPIPGVGTASGSASATYTNTFTSQTTYSVGISVNPGSTSGCYEFEYEFQGDNSGTYGLIAHVWNLGFTPGTCP
jgi:hypothetical protein